MKKQDKNVGLPCGARLGDETFIAETLGCSKTLVSLVAKGERADRLGIMKEWRTLIAYRSWRIKVHKETRNRKTQRKNVRDAV
ncbi:hypothetical protein V6R21_10970 [Limibacter armeniacum]|uniref:hypothetical protein n=1 Tax=Limibacter armeniacum TaxID=466084 RepID=UPI002FE53398